MNELNITDKKKSHSRSLTVLFALLCLFVFGLSFIALCSPAISKTNDTICGREEHFHSEDCFAEGGPAALYCGIYENNPLVVHQHDDLCYHDGMLICPIEELTHEHTEDCFDGDVLVCPYVYHQHSAQCFIPVDGAAPMAMICGKEAHEHSAGCFEIMSHKTPEKNEVVSDDDEPVELISDGAYKPMSVQKAPVILAERVDLTNAVDLTGYITDMTISYQAENGSWREINGSNNVDLPADADFRIRIKYGGETEPDSNKNIRASYIRSNGGILKLDGIPNWYDADANGTMVYNSQVVASIFVQDGTMVVKFDDSFLAEQGEAMLFGNIYLKGTIDWRNYGDDLGKINLPSLELTQLNFCSDLPSKYGRMYVDKLPPAIVKGSDGFYYLRYSIKVGSLEEADGVTIPDVSVRDIITQHPEFTLGSGVASYQTLPSAQSGYAPYETRQSGKTAGTIEPDGSGFCWSIGDLAPQEERVLTYFVKLSKSYTGSASRGNIENTAELFSDDEKRGEEKEPFRPHAGLTVNKSGADPVWDADGGDKAGSGYLTYTVNVKADYNNSYDLVNLTLKDLIGESFAQYAVVDSIKVDNVTVAPETQGSGVFTVNIGDLAPNASKTIVYTLRVDGLFAGAAAESFDFGNKAQIISDTSSDRGGAAGYLFGEGESIYTFSQSSWMRKLKGGIVNSTNVTMTGSRYSYSPAYPPVDGKDYTITAEGSTSASFTVPDKSMKYHVVLNEGGVWDMSSSSMHDGFDSDEMIYKGYMKVQEFPVGTDTGNPEALADTQALNTAWLDIDGYSSFSFMPSDIGMSGEKVYLLTYYAALRDPDGTGQLTISNSFYMDGTIGYGGRWYRIGGVKVQVGHVMQGNISYSAEKEPWYYSPQNKSSSRDIIYWVIKLRGTLRDGFTIKDSPYEYDADKKGQPYYTAPSQFTADSVLGIFRGPSDFDFEDYDDYSEFSKAGYGGMELIEQEISRYDYISGDDLDGRSFAITNININGFYGYLTGTRVNKDSQNRGVWGNKGIIFDYDSSGSEWSDSSTPQIWTFEKIPGTNKYYIRSTRMSNGVDETIYLYSKELGVDASTNPSDNDYRFTIEDAGSGQVYIKNNTGYYLTWYDGTRSEVQYRGYFKAENNLNGSEYKKMTLFEVSGGYHFAAGSQADDSVNGNQTYEEITLDGEYRLRDEEALYVVLKITNKWDPSTAAEPQNRVYENRLEIKDRGSSNYTLADTSEYVYKFGEAVKKEHFDVYQIENASSAEPVWKNLTYGKAENDYSRRNWHWDYDRWDPDEKIDGVYAEWTARVNYNGSIEGKAEICDDLPPGVEPVIVRLLKMSEQADRCPTYSIIPELENSDEWQNMSTTFTYDHTNPDHEDTPITLPFYYNSKTNQIRWNVDDLTKNTDATEGWNNRHADEYQIICRVTDPELLLNSGKNDLTNSISVKDVSTGYVSFSEATISFDPKSSLKKTFTRIVTVNNVDRLEEADSGDINMSKNSVISFKIKVNPCQSDFSGFNDGKLPPLVDELGEQLVILEDTLAVTDDSGTPLSGYTYIIREENGHQVLTVNGIPADSKMYYITYDTRTKTAPTADQSVPVSNKAYWAGYEQPIAPQVEAMYVYEALSDIVAVKTPTLKIVKVDSSNRVDRLNGAHFKMYEVAYNGSKTLVAEGDTAVDGSLIITKNIGNTEEIPKNNTLYYVEETKAPHGYEVDSEPVYFAVSTFNEQTGTWVFDAGSYSNVGNIDVWRRAASGDFEVHLVFSDSRSRIGIEKRFVDNDVEVTPVSGTYRFGIYDTDPDTNSELTPLQVLSIVYDENGDPTYFLNDVEVSSPEFTCAEPDLHYYIRELDHNRRPVKPGGILSAEGKCYNADYSVLSTTIDGDSVVITNTAVYFTLPSAGGSGSRIYILAGTIIAGAALAFLIIKKRRQK